MDKITFTLNGKPVTLTTDGNRMLQWVLRTDLGLTGTKYGCGVGLCGACTVLVDRKMTRACVTPVKNVAGKNVLTIEGLAADGKLHPLQEAFARHDAFQCGFCTPGMIMSAAALLMENPKATREDIIAHMDGNLCRCGAHTRILDAIEDAAKTWKGETRP
ncbi:MAG: (2Fe-2S)-binding protein [Candidatus Sumerlaeia bacterium]|nr:(2Fe-2S)-binding protein [Candidatus Sumerlaeia bacterium]